MSIFNCFVCVHVQYWYDALDCAVPKPNRYYAGIRVYEEKADDRTKAICLNSIWLNASRTCLSQTESRKRHIQFSRVSFFQLEFETIYGSYIWTSSSQISAKKARRHNLFLQIVFFFGRLFFFSRLNWALRAEARIRDELISMCLTGTIEIGTYTPASKK